MSNSVLSPATQVGENPSKGYMTRTLVCAGLGMVILLACIATGNEVEKDANSVGAKTNTGESADVLAHQLVRNELKAEDEDKTRWMYRVEHDEPGKS